MSSFTPIIQPSDLHKARVSPAKPLKPDEQLPPEALDRIKERIANYKRCTASERSPMSSSTSSSSSSPKTKTAKRKHTSPSASSSKKSKTSRGGKKQNRKSKRYIK